MSDLINRQDAINALTESNLKRHMDSVEGGQENRSAIRIIMELPSAERKHGEWIYDGLTFENDSLYKCSICCHRVPMEYGEMKFYSYCPNCGADMRGEKMPPKETHEIKMMYAVYADGRKEPIVIDEIKDLSLEEAEPILEEHDFVKVTRCKDCIWHLKDDSCARLYCITDDDFYCWHGRRERWQ